MEKEHLAAQAAEQDEEMKRLLKEKEHTQAENRVLKAIKMRFEGQPLTLHTLKD